MTRQEIFSVRHMLTSKQTQSPLNFASGCLQMRLGIAQTFSQALRESICIDYIKTQVGNVLLITIYIAIHM